MELIFDGLLERGEEGLIPWLAEDYKIEQGGRFYVFSLREGLKWQDGKPLTAEDVEFSFKYFLQHPPVWCYIESENIQDVQAVSKSHVKISLKKPDASMLYKIARVCIIPKHVWENVENPVKFTGPEAAIGSGPFRLTEYSKEHGTYRFEAWEGFWGPKQRIEAIEFVPVSDPVLAFKKGEIDLASIPPDVLGMFEDDPQFKVVRSPAFWGYRLLLNMEGVETLQNSK